MGNALVELHSAALRRRRGGGEGGERHLVASGEERRQGMCMCRRQAMAAGMQRLACREETSIECRSGHIARIQAMHPTNN